MRYSTSWAIALIGAFSMRGFVISSSLSQDVQTDIAINERDSISARDFILTLTYEEGDYVQITEVDGQQVTQISTITFETPYTLTITDSDYTGGSLQFTVSVPDPSPTHLTIVGTPIEINGPASTTMSALTQFPCSSPTCTPPATSISYTCPIKDGSTLPVVTTVQRYSCNQGQICTGTAVQETLTCNCGQPICATNFPLIVPIPIVVVPPGVPLPPEVPDYAPPLETMTPSVSSLSSSSSSLSSSSSTDSACSYASVTIPGDFDQTLSAWLSQFPFTLNTISSVTSASQTTSTHASQSPVSSISKTLSPSTATPKTSSTTTTSVSLKSTSSYTTSFDSAGASRSSIVSAASASSISAALSSSAVEATSTCAHWGAAASPSPIPKEWWGTNDPTKDGHRCIAEVGKMDINNYTWGEDWQYQPFSIDNGWDSSGKTLVEKFCQTLVDNVIVTYSGSQRGVCEVYGLGNCLREENGQCGMYEHISPANNGASVVMAVTYATGSPKCKDDETDEPTNYSHMTVEKCVSKLMDNIIKKCKFNGKPKRTNGYTYFPVLGGTFFDGCMRYTIIGKKNPPQVAW